MKTRYTRSTAPGKPSARAALSYPCASATLGFASLRNRLTRSNAVEKFGSVHVSVVPCITWGLVIYFLTMSPIAPRRVALALRAAGPEVIEVGVEELAPLKAGKVLVLHSRLVRSWRPIFLFQLIPIIVGRLNRQPPSPMIKIIAPQ